MNAFRSFIAIIFLAALAMRLINLPEPLTGIHEWRQCDTAAIARNFHSGGMELLYPEIDWRGSEPGFVETEFPLYPYAVAIVYGFSGVNAAAGRVLSMVCFAVAVYFFFLIVAGEAGEHAALFASAALSVLPSMAYYSTSFQPEAMYLMFTAAGLYLLLEWRVSKNKFALWGSAVLISLACLLKITNLYLAVPVLYAFAVARGRNFLFERETWMYASVVLIPVAAWYWHAHGIFLAYGNTFGIWDPGRGKWLTPDMFDPAFLSCFLFSYLSVRHFALIGLPLFAAGFIIGRRSGKGGLFDFWLYAFVLHVAVATGAHWIHDYYQLPLVMAGSFYIGLALDSIRKNFSAALSCAILVLLSFAGAWVYFGYIQAGDLARSPEYALASIARTLAPEGSYFVHVARARPMGMFRNADPIFFYHSGSKGWNIEASAIDERFVADKVAKGARYIAGRRSYFVAAGREGMLGSLLAEKSAKIYDDGEMFVAALAP